MNQILSGAQIRQSFIDFFVSKGHTFVPSASLVPGGDQTLLFTNAGMVQFKDVFLDTDHRPYSRAVNSQKCMRVAGKHNDLDEVGRDDSHHTFFEMLGNWSFGDYYKKEAIAWAWELLTEKWELDKRNLWVSVFKDEKGEIPTDDEAYENWKLQPGIDLSHILYFGRKENFWEMAYTGPCGPCSEIHIDFGPEFCDKTDVPGHICRVNGDCKRFLELWNLVFIQYNRLGPASLEMLPATHVDTGLGLDRIVSILQHVSSNYKTDLFMPLISKTMELAGKTIEDMEKDFTPYRVVADHARAAAFLIADGVVPGNIGRNYVCRMIIRRASRFAGKIGLNQPFLAKIAQVVIDIYGDAYPELKKNQNTILDNLTREEERFQRTVELGVEHLQELLTDLSASGEKVLDGRKAFELYATHGLPLEISRDIAREQGLDVDDVAFKTAMDEHRLASGGGKAFGPMGGEDVDVFRSLLEKMVAAGKITEKGVLYNPYTQLKVHGNVIAIVRDGIVVESAQTGETVEMVIPETCFYVESGGQVTDKGKISSVTGTEWVVEVEEVRKPAANMIVHIGKVIKGNPKVGDTMIAAVDEDRRKDIMRNHTATHLLHAQLHKVVGEHARQAGSLVAPDRLRFDFTQPDGLTSEQLERIEAGVNEAILADIPLTFTTKPLQQAISEGAMALFGEKYGEVVRTIVIGEEEHPTSYELCGGTHVSGTGDIGTFLILSEGSAAAGIRRIEAVTGRAAYELIQRRFKTLKHAASLLSTSVDSVPERTVQIMNEYDEARKQTNRLRQELVTSEFIQSLNSVQQINGTPVMAKVLNGADSDTLRQMTDIFRQKYPSSVVVLGSVNLDKPVIIASITDDLVKRGLHAGDLVKVIAPIIGGSGGGRPNLAQAGGKEPAKIQDALDQVIPYLKNKL